MATSLIIGIGTPPLDVTAVASPDGPALQLTTGHDGYAVLNREDVARLAEVLRQWLGIEISCVHCDGHAFAGIGPFCETCGMDSNVHGARR